MWMWVLMNDGRRVRVMTLVNLLPLFTVIGMGAYVCRCGMCGVLHVCMFSEIIPKYPSQLICSEIDTYYSREQYTSIYISRYRYPFATNTV